ncbi:MAG: CopG family transcriptional regulator [Flavobacteriales bacterium]|nr:CopG family transcriptional regulator [Flavobacteriales bacterium]|tara:strand:+ start:101 stop:343 length:243 start_codon:yes stop_codon:yes gene_type:complete
MSTFTSSLPDDLLQLLNEQAKQLAVPKNKLIEKALRIYLNQVKRMEYIKSYQQMSEDSNILDMAEEGMADYLKQIENEES